MQYLRNFSYQVAQPEIAEKIEAFIERLQAYRRGDEVFSLVRLHTYGLMYGIY